MARITLGQAHARAVELERTIARLFTIADQRPHGTSARMYDQHVRQLMEGRRHEVQTLQRQITELAAALAPAGAPVDGKLGGQRLGGHSTSAEALELVAPKVGTQRARVLEVMRHPRNAAGMTDVELSNHTDLSPNSLRPRRVELTDAGWVEDSGRRRQHRGRDHVVWTLTAAARQTDLTPSTDTESETP